MARARTIKPGIMTNDELCELGMPAYILFTGLWMLADREGRIEDRPKRIKAEAMPLWEEISWQTVEKLLESLSKAGFIERYSVDGCAYLSIVKWDDHQHPHPNEAPSKIPPPPLKRSAAALKNSRNSNPINEDAPRCEGLHTKVRSTRALSSGSSGSSCESSSRAAFVESSPVVPRVENPPPTTTKKPEHKTQRKDAGRADGPWQVAEARAAPHAPEAVRLIRESLKELARQIGMPPPDDGIVVRVLDAGRGAEAREIHEALVMLWKRNKFRNMQSWGFVPLVVAQSIQAA